MVIGSMNPAYIVANVSTFKAVYNFLKKDCVVTTKIIREKYEYNERDTTKRIKICKWFIFPSVYWVIMIWEQDLLPKIRDYHCSTQTIYYTQTITLL